MMKEVGVGRKTEKEKGNGTERDGDGKRKGVRESTCL